MRVGGIEPKLSSSSSSSAVRFISSHADVVEYFVCVCGFGFLFTFMQYFIVLFMYI